MPISVTAERGNVRRLATTIAAERARPTATPYPTPAVVPRLERTRAEVLATMAVRRDVYRTDAKLMRMGDWRRTGIDWGREPDDAWVWVRAWWGEDFEPWGQRLAGVRLTWSASIEPAIPDPRITWTSGSLERPVPPPVWDDLPDYSALAQP
jgi:hypothetical protein